MNEHDLALADAPTRAAWSELNRLALAGKPLAKEQRPPETVLAELQEPDATPDAPVHTWSEQSLRNLLETLPDAFVVIGGHGTIVLVNQQTERIFGYKRDEMLGRPIEMLIPERYRRGHVDRRNGYFEKPGSRPMGAKQDLFGRRKDGTEFPVEISLSPLVTEKGTFATSVIRDISQRKREEAKFRTLVENIPAVTFIAPLDESLPEIYVSPQIEEMLGFSQKEWMEDPVLWHRQLHPEDRERWNREFAPTCVSGQPFRSIYRFVAKDGHVVWVHGSASVVRDSDGNSLFLQGVAFDITAIKKAEVELREARETLHKANEELERRVKERTEELECFAYQASHDLSIPLRSLKSYPKLLAENYGGKIDKEADGWINRTIDSAERLGHLIGSLKQYSKVVERARAYRPTGITASANEAWQNLSVEVQESGAQLVLDPLPAIMGDHAQLVFLFQNLIGNAIKFRDPSRPIRIEIGASRPDQDFWQFWVRDNGIGIEKKFLTDRPKLFQTKFGDEARVAPKPSQYPGSGYGLHICKVVVTRHGGRIWVESEFGKGSTFFFTLPALPTTPLSQG